MNNRALLLMGIFLSVFTSCELKLSDKEKQAYAQEFEERKIFRVTDEEIQEFVQQVMMEIDTIDFTTYTKNELGWARVHLMEDPAKADTKIKQVYEAYQYSLEKGEKLTRNFQKTTQGDFVISYPIVQLDTLGNRSLQQLVNITLPKAEIIKEMTIRKEED